MHPIQSFRDLTVWQRSIEMVQSVYNLTDAFPKREMYGLSQQMRRCSVSVPSNIAEGQARTSTKEYLHFLSIAHGSLSELLTQLEIAHRQKFLSTDQFEQVVGTCDQVSRMLRALKKSLNLHI